MINEINKLEDYLINESEISLIDIQKISTYLTNIREAAINYTRCCDKLKGKEAISFGRYCASRGYHKYEGNWVNRQRIPRDIEWIKKMYNKEIFDL